MSCEPRSSAGDESGRPLAVRPPAFRARQRERRARSRCVPAGHLPRVHALALQRSHGGAPRIAAAARLRIAPAPRAVPVRGGAGSVPAGAPAAFAGSLRPPRRLRRPAAAGRARTARGGRRLRRPARGLAASANAAGGDGGRRRRHARARGPRAAGLDAGAAAPPAGRTRRAALAARRGRPHGAGAGATPTRCGTRPPGRPRPAHVAADARRGLRPVDRHRPCAGSGWRRARRPWRASRDRYAGGRSAPRADSPTKAISRVTSAACSPSRRAVPAPPRRRERRSPTPRERVERRGCARRWALSFAHRAGADRRGRCRLKRWSSAGRGVVEAEAAAGRRRAPEITADRCSNWRR